MSKSGAYDLSLATSHMHLVIGSRCHRKSQQESHELLHAALLMLAVFPGVGAVRLPQQYSTVPTGRGNTIQVGTVLFQQILTVVAGGRTWGSLAESTSHDVRSNLIQVVNAHAGPNNEAGVFMAVVIFASLITNRSGLTRVVEKLNASPAQANFWTALGISSAQFLGFVQNHLCDWVQEEVVGTTVAVVHIGSCHCDFGQPDRARLQDDEGADRLPVPRADAPLGQREAHLQDEHEVFLELGGCENQDSAHIGSRKPARGQSGTTWVRRRRPSPGRSPRASTAFIRESGLALNWLLKPKVLSM